uniref:Uncharacterized protein n=1 Tax=Arundo donax TaxID=35708 RepID=A0A0A8ZIT9_ARUDO
MSIVNSFPTLFSNCRSHNSCELVSS